jgi:long-chain acyl-CoA synthetase
MRNPALMDHYHNLPQQTAKALDDGLGRAFKCSMR